MRLFLFALSVVGIGILTRLSMGGPEKTDFSTKGPLSPREERATIRPLKGFKVELVASEPDVIDPVALAFDENGRLFVVEMHAYPNEGVGTGFITSGKIKLLEDRDGDGYFEKSTIYAENLRLPTSVMPYRGGILVANAPEIIFLEDTDGDGRADRKRTLYTGFNLANIQQMVNSLQWGLDNWVYGCAGSNGGQVHSGEKEKAPAVDLRNRGIRFHPDRPASLEPTAGGGQFGLAADDWGRWFTATNSQHLRHIILPDHYLRRNPFLAVSAVTLDIPDHGAACSVHRISPFEGWRVERTRRRKGGPDAKRFSPTELVPGGFITSACSPLVYTGDLFPREFYGQTLVCDPANNLIHRDLLVPNGATFRARRGDPDCEFLASTDNWFRPVNLILGPDGAIYVADFYREVIETPLSLPADIKKKLNLQSRGRGRIWRVIPETSKRDPGRSRPALGKASSVALVKYLDDRNSWWRLTSQRLLVEKQDKSIVPGLRKLVRHAKTPPGKVHALWTLAGLGALTEDDVEIGLKDVTPGVRENALRLAEGFLGKSKYLRQAVAGLADDADPRVRFQLSFTLGTVDDPLFTTALGRIARRDFGDPWTQTALLSSATRMAPAFLEKLVLDREFISRSGSLPFVSKLASLVGARAEDGQLAGVLGLLRKKEGAAWQVAVLEGLGQGLQNSRRSLEDIWERPSPALKPALESVKGFFVDARDRALDDKKNLTERLTGVRLLGYGPPALSAKAWPALLAPQQPQEMQLAAVRAVSLQTNSAVADILLAHWGSFSPIVRREVVESLLARPDRVEKLLGAIEKKKVLAGQLETAKLDRLRKHPNLKLRQKALKLLAGLGSPDRRKVVDAYRDVLKLKGDQARGKMIFKKTCSTCHRLENEGQEVGADLMAALRTKTPGTLLVDILDPSREVDPRYIEYIVTTQSGKVVTGLITAETASSLTLRRAEKVEETILRSQIESIQATSKSLMPEGLEMQLRRQDLADLIAYLLTVVDRK